MLNTNTNAIKAINATEGIKAVKRVDAAVNPVSPLSLARKASTLYAYLDKPAELLSLKMLDKAKTAYKLALETSKPMEDVEYTFCEADKPYIKYAIAKFTASGFGVEVINGETIKLVPPIGHLKETK